MRGYIYVLVNSSLPGLVKVGKTTRSPSERADELSGATGVPTPFVIAYEQLFEDCSAAERYLHSALADRGTRLSANREFFTAKPADVIRIIMSAPGLLDSADARAVEADGGSVDADEPPLASGDPWGGLMEEAASYEFGIEGKFQDYKRAYQLYTRAASLGSADAYEKMGVFHMRGLGMRSNADKALECFEQSIELGNFYAYSELARLYQEAGHKENFEKCLKALAEARKQRFKGKVQTAEERAKYVVRLTDVLVMTCHDWSTLAIPAEIIRFGRDIQARVEHLKAEHERAYEERRYRDADNLESPRTYDAILSQLRPLVAPQILVDLGLR